MDLELDFDFDQPVENNLYTMAKFINSTDKGLPLEGPPINTDGRVTIQPVEDEPSPMELTIMDIRDQMQTLRETLPQFKKGIADLNGEKSELSKSYDMIREAARIALQEVEEERRLKEAAIKDTLKAMDEVDLELKRLAKLQAQLIEQQSSMEELLKLRKEIQDICADFPAWASAHEYQLEDILFTIQAYQSGRNGVLNANDMGLGKTYETIVSLYIIKYLFEAEHKRKPRILWLTKKNLAMKSTPNEIRRWWKNSGTAYLDGSKPAKDREMFVENAVDFGSLLVTNYETVRTTKVLASIRWDIIVIDEVHKLKGGANQSGPTAIWTAIKDVCAKAKFTMMLSGTPMVNRVAEMWAYLHIFAPERFPTLRSFEDGYTVMQRLGYETKMVIDVDKLLQQALKGQVIRRRRDEVGLQLPICNQYDRVLSMNSDQEEVYIQFRDRFFVWLDEQQGKMLSATSILAQLTRLRQINVWPAGIQIKDDNGRMQGAGLPESSSKIDEAMDIIEELDSINEQVILACNYKEPLQEIRRRCLKANITCEVIDGDYASPNAEVNFQQGKTKVLCMILGMGEGLNLQKNPGYWPGGASTAIQLDRWWNPSRNEQFSARIDRQGATEPTTVITLVNEGTVDLYIRAIEDEKAEAFGQVMESDVLRPSSDWKNYLKGLL